MPSTKATVSYKKKDGSLTISDDGKSVVWTANLSASTSAVTITIADVTNLQQTPESSAKVALKVFVKDENYVFNFTHPSNARREQETITEVLRDTIAANKTSTNVPTTTSVSKVHSAVNGDAGQSAAMAMSKAISSKHIDEKWYDDGKLRQDVTLQRSLLESNKMLKERFEQSLRHKPEAVSVSQFTAQFWSTRLHLLRAHAIESAQRRGEYNVLPEIRFVRKPAEKEGEPDIKQLQISKEQIKLIFKQYPVVSQAYNENCPPLNPGEFWTRFFNSRLLKKLKGERISQQDPPDPILDKYLDRKEGNVASLTRVPNFIDLEGNEQNHSQRKGNRPDQDMRPSSTDKIPILRVLNNLSEEIMSRVAPEDGEAHGPIGQDEETFEELRLRDLARHDVDNRVVLNIKEHTNHGADRDLSAEAKLYAQQEPKKVLAVLRSDLDSAFGGDSTNLAKLIGYQSDDDSDSDEETAKEGKATKFGSRTAMGAAMSSMLGSIEKSSSAGSSEQSDRAGLSQTVFDNLREVHNTSTEFLHQFWIVYLSGDATRAEELAQAVGTLERSLDRINAVGVQADTERREKIAGMKKQLEDHHQRTGKKRNVNWDTVVLGGGKEVNRMVRPTVEALEHALALYRKALEKQTKEAEAEAL